MPKIPKHTRERILAEAQRQFCAFGYYGTDSNRIARGAGFSPQTFYRHFVDKRAVFLEVYEVFSRAVVARVAAATSARQLVRSIVTLHRQWGAFRPSLISLHATDESVREVRWHKRNHQLNELCATLGIERGDALFLLWVCEHLADGVAQGEVKAMKVGERALVERFATLIAPLWEGAQARETRTR
jgi:AcrR family transcriptional regulator